MSTVCACVLWGSEALPPQDDVLSTLRALERQIRTPDRIVVLDLEPHDTPPEVLTSHPSIELLRRLPGESLAAALQRLLSSCEHDFLALLEAGARPEPSWLELLIAAMPFPIAGARGQLVHEGAVYLGSRWLAFFGEGLVGDTLETQGALLGRQALFRVDLLREVDGFPAWPGNFADPGPVLHANSFVFRFVPAAKVHVSAPAALCEALDLHWRRTFPARWAAFSRASSSSPLRQVLEASIRSTTQAVQHALVRRRSHLLYPSLLLTLRAILLDVLTAPEFSDVPKAPLLEALVGGFVAPVLHGPRADLVLAQRYLEDVVDLVPDALAQPFMAWLAEEGDQLHVRPASGPEAPAETPSLPEVLEPFRADLEVLLTLSRALHFQLGDLSQVGTKVLTSSAARDRFERAHVPLITGDDFRVLLANAPWRTADGRLGVRAGSRWPFTMAMRERDVPVPHYCPFPFFLAYAASHLKARGIASLVVDAIGEGLTDEEFLALSVGYRPSLIFLETATASIEVDLGYARALKDALPEAKICLTGTHASICGPALLSEHAFLDFTLSGELELAAVQLSQALRAAPKERDSLVATVKGISYRAGGLVVAASAAEPPDFATLPWPERMMLPMYNYNDRPVDKLEWPGLQVVASRGCPFQCTFCVWPQVLFHGSKRPFRPRDPDDVAEEIRVTVDLFGFKSFYLDDDTFNIGDKRMQHLARAFRTHGLHRLPWMGMARSDTCSPETFRALKEAGMVAIKFGVETGDPVLMENIRKGLELDTVATAVEACRALEVQVHLTYSIGLPGETFATIRRTFEHALMREPDSIQLSMLVPFPGTELYRQLEAQGKLDASAWKDFDGMRSSVALSDSLTQQEIEEAHIRFLTLWGAYRRREVPSLRDVLAMYGGASLAQVDQALRGDVPCLPSAPALVVQAVREAWPLELVATLQGALSSGRVAVIGEPSGYLATHLSRRMGREVHLVETDPASVDFVKFLCLCARSSLEIRAELDVDAYSVAIVGTRPEVADVLKLRRALQPNGLLLVVSPQSRVYRNEAEVAMQAAGMKVVDIVDECGFCVVIGQNRGPRPAGDRVYYIVG